MNVLSTKPLSPEELRRIDAYWRAANYLAVGEIFLRDNPLLKEPLKREHVKPRMLGHWGTSPGLNLIYAHANRLIVNRDLDAIFIAGPGHGGPAVVANAYLEGTYSELYPDVAQDVAGLARLFTQFAWPAGVGSHTPPETPGSIHEGGDRLSLAHAFARRGQSEPPRRCVVGDGGGDRPARASWHPTKFNPARDGAVLGAALNGFKIANLAALSRFRRRSSLRAATVMVFRSPETSRRPCTRLRRGDDDRADTIRSIQRRARHRGRAGRAGP